VEAVAAEVEAAVEGEASSSFSSINGFSSA
jgi:hypothetical protein